MRPLFLCLFAAVACGTTAHGSIDIEAGGGDSSAGSETKPHPPQGGGSQTLNNGGSVDGRAGEVTLSEPTGGKGGVVGFVPDGGASGEPSASAGGAPTIVNSGGVSNGGEGGDTVANAGEPSVAVQPWKICQGGEICDDSEICVFDSPIHRICTPIDDQFHRCQPLPAPKAIADACAKLQPGCQNTWKLCNIMSRDAQGDDCGPIHFSGGERWNCGPPAP